MLEVEIYSLFSQNLIIKLINLMANLESFKGQSPVTTDSPAVKCKILCLDLGVVIGKKTLQPIPCGNKDIGRALHLVTQCLLMLLTLTI